jgi:hypothetical protein
MPGTHKGVYFMPGVCSEADFLLKTSGVSGNLVDEKTAPKYT